MERSYERPFTFMYIQNHSYRIKVKLRINGLKFLNFVFSLIV